MSAWSIEIRPVAMDLWPDAHVVDLVIGARKFCVSPHGCETRADAEWVAGMVRAAMAEVEKAAQGAVPAAKDWAFPWA